jgi:hypothetical protein
MYTARFEGDHKTCYVSASEIDNPERARELAAEQKFRCPGCGKPLRFRGRVNGARDWHFAHFEDDLCELRDCSCYPDYPETPEHSLLKDVFRRWLAAKFGTERVRTEEAIETQRGQSQERRPQEGKQFADVWLDLKSSVGSSGCQFAFEIQRSPINPKEWKRRREGYRSQGIHDEWILIGEAFDIGQHGDNFRLGGLPRTIVEETGRLLWIEGKAVQHVLEINKKIVDDEKESILTPEQVQIRVLEPIAGHHSEVRGDPTGHALWLEDKNPGKEHLLEKGPWRKTLQGPSLTVESENAQIFSLSQLHVAKKNPFVVLESPLASSTEVYDAWCWEQASRLWAD